jgi:N-acetylmuramoyl-L-alanine amidase
MATATINPSLEQTTSSAEAVAPLCSPGQTASNSPTDHPADSQPEPSRHDTLQTLLAFLALHEQVRRRKETRRTGDDGVVPEAELEAGEQFTLDEVLQLVADIAVAITGADGLAIALAGNDEIVLRAAAGTVRPNLGARIDRDSSFSGACFRTAQILTCADTETDARVNLQACRHLGARSMVAVPLCGRRGGIGLLQAFSAQPFAFNDSDVRKLSLLAELVMGALTPEDEARFAESAQVAATKLGAPPSEAEAVLVAETEMPAVQPDSLARRPGMAVLLVCIVTVSALVGGAWWKLKPSQLANKQLANQMVRTNPANTKPGATSNGSRATNSPAKAQNVSKLPMVTGIQHWSSADSSTVVLNLEDQVQYEAHRLANPDRIYFDLHDTDPASDLAWKSIEVGDALLQRVRVAQPVTGMTRIVLETKANTDFSVILEPNPYRLLVELRKVGASPEGALNRSPNATEAEKNKRAILVPPPTQEDLQLQRRVGKMRIVVDAGHGGRDGGTVGRDGLLEKDLVLEIGQRLGKLLETRLGMEVIYTREDDSYVPLAERASIANQAQADLFVSVHANYSDLPSARGVETYYTSFFTVAPSKDVDMRSGAGGRNTATASLSPADLQERVEQSRRLAESVQRSLYGTLSAQTPGLRDRGIREGTFVVLTESAMPGILAEVSFVSSPTDEQKLRSDGYREQVAEALYKGIARYAASSHGIKVASARQ